MLNISLGVSQLDKDPPLLTPMIYNYISSTVEKERTSTVIIRIKRQPLSDLIRLEIKQQTLTCFTGKNIQDELSFPLLFFFLSQK